VRPGPVAAATALLAVAAVLLNGCAGDAEAPPPAATWSLGPALPIPVGNNAVAGLVTSHGPSVFSFMGIDSTKVWSGVTSRAFRWDMDSTGGWMEIDPVPGPGRLAAVAQGFEGRVYLFGGYTVAEDGSEVSAASVDVYDPELGTWSSAAPIPLPVDDAVSGVWGDSLIVLVSGWHDGGNVPDVQFYDPRSDSWRTGAGITGTPVFGHSGGVTGDAVVYLDGAKVVDGTPRYVLDRSTWLGRLGGTGTGDASPRGTEVEIPVAWSRLTDHPGPPLYRSAGLGVDGWVLFAGGSDNPYNYDGQGYDGTPSEPLDQVLAFRVSDGTWHALSPLPTPTMDHRALATVDGRVVLAGGIGPGQVVRAGTYVARLEELLESRRPF